MKPFTASVAIGHRIAWLLLMSFVVSILLGPTKQASAQTYSYIGNAFDSADCQLYYGPGLPCVDGNATATAIVTVGSNYTGTASGGQLPVYSLTLNGVGAHVDTNSCLNGTPGISFYNGQITDYYFAAYDTCVSPQAYAEQAGSFHVDDGLTQTPLGALLTIAWVHTAGTWTNSKALGRPAPLPQVADASPTVYPQSKPDCPCDGSQLGSRGEPIDIGSGNLFEQVTDYTTVGQNPLAFIRYYNSMATSNTLATTLGQNWRSNYDRYLQLISASAVEAERPDGKVVGFNLVGSVWTPDTDVDMTLTNSGSTWTLTDHDDTIETYTASGSVGTLNSIALPNGYTQTLNYTGSVLTSVSDSYSRSLSFTYTGTVLTGVSTPDSATLTYGYTSVGSQNLLTSVTYNTSPTTSQIYSYTNVSYPFALTGITDENGNSYASWSYDGTGRCTMSEHAGGADEVQVTYNYANNVTVTNPLGEQETYTFTYVQGVPKATQIDRAASSPVAAASRYFTYDGNGYLATATDWNGNETTYTNDSHGDPTSITEAYGTGRARTTSITYDSTWVHKPYTITKTNVTEDDRYDATYGTLTTRTLTDTTGGATNGDTEVWAYTYTSYGLLHTETFPRTATTVKNTYTYSSGALASISDQLSHTTTINTANGTGQPTQITDPNSVVTNLVYDHRNRLTSKTVVASPSNELTSTTYIGSGQPHVVTLPDSSTITYDYDNAQRVTKITNTAGETINYTLDAMGDVTALATKDSGGTTRKSWTATYDVLGDRLTLVGAGGAGQTTNYSYDGMKNRTSTTDANSKVWSQAWDELLRPTTVTDPLTHTAVPTYNNLDFTTAQTDFNGYSTGFTRDAFGNAIARTSPDTGSWSFTFNEDNKLTGVTDARSVASTLSYDAGDRLTGVSITGYSGEAESFGYDDTTSGNKGVGRLTSVSDESGSTARVFDNFGAITSETRVIGGKTYAVSYSHDLANRITEIIYPSGRYVDFTYDSSGYLTTVTTKPSSMGSVTTLASSITHKPFGPIASFTYGNSEAQTRSYDNNYWPTALSTVHSGTYVQELSFGEDYAGNITSITDTLDSTRNESFGVDDLNRLHTASGKYGSRTYTYDNNSSRATKYDGTTTWTTTNVSSSNLPDNITDGTNTRHFTWTANGDMATDDRVFVGGGAAAFTYGGRNLLESMTVNSQGITYKLNGLGQRVSEAFSGSTTHYIHDIRGNVIAEADGSSGTTTMEYVWMEGELLAQIDGSGNIVYVHNSHIGAPQKITNPSRTLVFDQIREPFGEVSSTPTSTTPTNWRFPGQYANANNSLSHNGARDYDPACACYVESDPSGLAGGLNPIAYAGQNPTQTVDPLGLAALPAEIAADVVFDAAATARLSAAAGVANALLDAAEANTLRLVGVEGAEGLVDALVGNPTPAPVSGPVCSAGEANALSTLRYTQEGETFLRYESDAPAFSRVTSSGGVTPGTFAAPASDGLVPISDRAAVYNLPNPEISRPNAITLQPPAGTAIIGPKPVEGGTGSEVIFPNGF
jgi:RHS repeat-associated protein